MEFENFQQMFLNWYPDVLQLRTNFVCHDFFVMTKVKIKHRKKISNCEKYKI